MTLFDALRHQWRRRTRSPTWGRSLIGALVLLLAAGYFGVLFVALGWFFPDIVAEVALERKPLQLLNGFLLHGAVGLVPARFFLQRSAGSDVRPYLHLSLRRPQIVRLMQVLSSLSLLNLLPLLVLAALWGRTVLPATSAVGATYWAVGALLLVAATQFLNSLLRAVRDRNAGLVLGAAGLLAVLIIGSNWTGAGVLRWASTWLFEGLAAGRILPLTLLFAGTGVLTGAAHRMLRGRLYSVLGDVDSSRTQSTGVLRGVGRGQGHVASLALLDLKLILRNKRPRQMLGAGLLVIGPFLGILLLGEEVPPMNVVLFGFVLSGYLGLTYMQFGYAWHGAHFDGLLARAVAPRLLVQAQVVTFVGLCMAPLMLIVPVIAAVRPQLLASLGSFFLYNAGVTAPLFLVLGTWGRTALKLDQSTFFNYQGTSTHHFLMVLPVMGLPIGLVVGVGLSPTLLVAAGLGLLGLVTVPLWTQGVGRLLWQQRHAMASGFRDE
ncbi:DUF5687 family protein [Salinibacter altiplanensis]|uniref:DUF5687 family protein n=1 Tax=Salinibacter altiplanensis TaxID=1803181 RepID=UPI000C9F1D35|nr:DUF5687 family protein [Salinibacter altiplanensis]